MKYDVVKDLSVVTTISEKMLRKLISKGIYCINDAVVENNLTEDPVVDLDIGLGNLAVKLDGDKLQYKFTPSPELEESIKLAVLNEQNLLEDALDATLADRVVNTYKDFI